MRAIPNTYHWIIIYMENAECQFHLEYQLVILKIHGLKLNSEKNEDARELYTKKALHTERRKADFLLHTAEKTESTK